ncbi:glycoside hydrolase family 2 TIM barrel-domain containing protein [Chelativorans sp.]|uniref:glycoside hydrolase family 2 protein n=1 Tax=Chelativorans sp. TaxID=2203393 RepID=UPI002812035B|nr:glycoside hydrolase family 2 TIM barrel-domain containing protein [Chelativorans sp.]
MRSSLSLDGPWEFRWGDGEARTATVPGPWQAQFDDLRWAAGTGVYTRSVQIPAAWREREVALLFGAVSDLAVVFWNGEEIGRHEGGYLPFEVVVPGHLLREKNRLEVWATLPEGGSSTDPNYSFAEIPHGKQSWYGPLGGIWQSVRLEARDPRHIRRMKLTPELLTGRVEAEIALAGAPAGARLRLQILHSLNGVVAEAEVPASDGTKIVLTVQSPIPWSPDRPELYQCRAELVADGAVVDCIADHFGFRSFEARDGRFYLNGEPLYLRGALDQDYYPDGICTPPSVEFLEDQLRKAKQLGLNCLRCHIKVPDPRYYEVADRLGMLVWTEIPNAAHFSESSAERLIETMKGILERDFNHPSIICWTIINEDWGTRLTENPEHRAWLKATFDWLKAADSTRLVVDNSACIPNFHLKTDIDDFHYYRSVPERRAEWDRLTEEFAGRPAWSFSPHGDAERTGREPLVVSEFGVWGLPNPADLRREGTDPWWFETGQNWGDGVAYPHGIEHRFSACGLDKVFASFDDFIEAAQWYQFENLKYEIETIRAHASIAGYVITEFTDVHWESNGLLDMERNPRVFHERFGEINADTVIVPMLDRRGHWAGSTLRFSPRIASGGRGVPEGARLEWSLAGLALHGSVAVPPVPPLSTGDAAEIVLTLPEVDSARMFRLDLTLRHGRDELSRNCVDIALYPKRSSIGLPSVATRDHALADYLAGLGLDVKSPETADVIVSRALSKDDMEAMRLGACYLVLADGSVETHGTLRSDPPPREQPFMPVVDEIPGIPSPTHHREPGIGLHQREGTIWRGDWIASFSWIRRQGAFARLPGGPLLDLSFDRVVPLHVMTGFRRWEFETRIHAGLAVGWIHKPAATIAERPFGKGGLVATTFRLTQDAPGEDPVATTLFSALIETAAAKRS